jgi:recombination protein RecT
MRNTQKSDEQKHLFQQSPLALTKKAIVDVVGGKIQQYVRQGDLHLPANYSVENAMKSAWLILQSTLDKNNKPALETCTKDSIANALLDMAIQGLNPAKKQCYFIAYGDKLVCMRSYFGAMAVAKNVSGAKDVYAQVVYKGDEFLYEIVKGRKKLVKHLQNLDNVKPENIVAAYCVIEFEDGREHMDIMTMDQIRKSWTKSQLNPSADNSTHKQFAEEMCKRTIINRTCKAFINSSSDNSLLLQHFNKADETVAEQEVEDEIAENANRDYIDVEATENRGNVETCHESEQDDNRGQEQPAGPEKKKAPAVVSAGTTGQQAIGGPGF